MQKNIRNISLIVLVLALSSLALSQVGGRKTFRGDGDNNRNFVVLQSNAALQTTMAMTSSFDCMVEVRTDSIQDAPRFELNVQLGTLTTGNSTHDMEVFSPQFLNWKGATSANFTLIEFNQSRNYVLENEKATPASGRGALTIGGRTDTVTVELSLRYLEANDVTRGRLPGDLMHVVGTIFFRLSDLGMEIPQEALLRLDDRMQFKFDAFCSTQR